MKRIGSKGELIFLHKVFIPVIHAESLDQVQRNTRIAFENGADGIFLINHSISSEQLLDIYVKIRDQYPHSWIGLNLLGLSPLNAVEMIPDNADGLWLDDGGYDDRLCNPRLNAMKVSFKLTAKANWKGLLFGGLAFKGQRPVDNLEQATQSLSQEVDVITTAAQLLDNPLI